MDISPEMKASNNDNNEYRQQTADMNEYRLYAALLEYHIPWLSPFVIVSGRYHETCGLRRSVQSIFYAL